MTYLIRHPRHFRPFSNGYSEAPTLRAIALAASKENAAPVFGKRNPVREPAFDRSYRFRDFNYDDGYTSGRIA